MNKHLLSLAASGALALIAAPSHSAVEYVKICSIYGAGFHYIPGTDVCVNETNGDTRQQTEAGTWRSLTPYPEGEWVAFPKEACPNGRVVTLGTFSAKDFTLNPWGRMQSPAVSVLARRGDYVSKVIMSGGFLDPRTPHRNAVNTSSGLCVRSTDPNVMEDFGAGPYNPTFGNGMLPIGCIANSRILGMPAAYSVSATAAYPEIDSGYTDVDQTNVAGPYTYGSKLVVTTDFGGPTFQQLTYYDARSASYVPLAGSVTVSVCVR